MSVLDGKRVLVTGGTGSLGMILLRRLLADEPAMGTPARIIVFSRDETKQHQLRLLLSSQRPDTEGIVYRDHEHRVQFHIGDVRNPESVAGALAKADIVINTAALKQVPTCEYFPGEAVLTNVVGAMNIVQAIERHRFPIETVVGVSTDKACKPVNVMGMTKAIQERIFSHANLAAPGTRFVGVRYGNVLASRGSVIPLFLAQIVRGGPVTVTTSEMTRFLMSLDQAVDTIFAALRSADPGEIFVPRAAAARVVDVARVLIGSRSIPIEFTGIRPGEKTHEVLISEEEVERTRDAGEWIAIRPILPELRMATSDRPYLTKEYSSEDGLMGLSAIRDLLERNALLHPEEAAAGGKALR